MKKTTNSIRQYHPAFMEGFENKTIEFSTTEELFHIPFVKNFIDKKFLRFAMEGDTLMAIYDDGFEWWVVGFIKNPKAVKLPKWGGWKFRALLDGKEVVLGDEVVSSCGGVLTLKDGRTARDLKYPIKEAADDQGT